MIIPILMSSLAILVATGGTAAAQTPPDEARELFRQVALTQTPEGPAPVIERFRASFDVELLEDEKGQPAPTRSGRIEQTWRRKGDAVDYRRVLRVKDSPQAPTHYVFSKSRYLFMIEGEEPRLMTDDANLAEDVKSLQAEVARTTELVQLFFVGALEQPETLIAFGKPEVLVPDPAGDPRRGTKPIPTRELVVARPDERVVVLRVGLEDLRIYEAEVRPLGPDGTSEIFRFGFHEVITDPEVGKVLIPTRIVYMKGDRVSLRANVPVDRPSHESVAFNLPLRDKDFRLTR